MSNEKAKKIAALKAGLSEIKLYLDRKDEVMVREILHVMAEVVFELEVLEREQDDIQT